MFATCAGGALTHRHKDADVRSTAGFHECSFVYAPDSVAFYADRQGMQYWDTGVPRTAMHLMLDGRKPKKNAFTYVDGLSFEARP